MIVPPPVRPGDRVRVIAPSGPFDRTLVWRGLGFLATRYRLVYTQRIFSRTGYLAGSDADRLDELNRALEDRDARAIFAARGGYGLGRIAHDARVDALLDAPKWIVGFSDVTALHAEALAAGVASLHAHNVAGLGRGDALGRDEWLDALEAPARARSLEGLRTWRSGTARGCLVGGNLTVLFTSYASGRVRFPDGAVLFLEDVGEAPYRLDRMVTALTVAGALRRVSAVLLGEFTDAPAGKHGVRAEDALRDVLLPLGVPVLAGVRAGHGRHNVPLHLGYDAEVDGDGGRIVLSPPGR